MLNLTLSLLALQLLILSLIRPLLLWYLKINRIVDALEDIAESLRTLPTVQRHDQATGRRPARAA